MKIIWISDFGTGGSGYFNISSQLCQGLAERGYDIKAIGLEYKGEQHDFDFSIIPAANFQLAHAIGGNLVGLWKPDVIVTALDIHHQEVLIRPYVNQSIPYVGITPIEADPLCMSWAMVLTQMQKVFIISDFGTKEAEKVNVPAVHLKIGVDTDLWSLPDPDERAMVRENMGLADKFVILTVADNQERKNISRLL